MGQLAKELKNYSQSMYSSHEIGEKIKSTKWEEYFLKHSNTLPNSSSFHKAIQQI